MNKNEAKELMKKYLMRFIEPLGYKEKKGKYSDFEFYKVTKNGKDVINGSFNDYNPVQQIVYNLSKKNKYVLTILEDLQKQGIKMNPPISKETSIIGFGYTSLNGLKKGGHLPEMQYETDVEMCVGMMVHFLEGTAFPLMNIFEDLREIDKIINGEEPWTTDWLMPYALGGNFYEKRLIIAKLSGNPKIEQLIDFNYATLERLSAENGHPFTYDRNDLSKPLPALIKLLEDVKPLY